VMAEAKEKRQKLEVPSPEHRRTLRFLVSLAAQVTFPDRTLSGGHAVGDGYVFSIGHVSLEQLASLEAGVRSLIARDLPIVQHEVPFEKVLTYLENNRQPHAALLLRSRVSKSVRVSECNGQLRLYATDLYASTGCIRGPFGFHSLNGEFVLSHTAAFVAQPAIMQSIREHQKWGQTSAGITSFGQLNNLQYLPVNTRRKLILECEFRQEQKLCEIASRIAERQGKVRVLCIA